ncbi:MAG: ATP-binding protein [Polyangiaceae bacterium]|nr:ATP-binding protein [Polyangiaceae bacterium]
MEKFFNTAGPNKPTVNYTVDPFKRINWPELIQLINQERYFVLHAPRQTGKTTLLNAIVRHLNAEGIFEALYINVEDAQPQRNNIARASKIIAEELVFQAKLYLPQSELAQSGSQILLEQSPELPVKRAISYWASHSNRSTVLMIDEIDSLVGDSLLSLLRQLRSGYNDRPKAFPQSIVLCGVRDVRDYRINTSGGDVIVGGSCFNVKAKSLRLGNFSESEVRDLYNQHTAETGQIFEEPIFSRVMELTGGQPWLVNSIASELTQETEALLDRSRVITLDDLIEAKEKIIRRCDCHIDQLIAKLAEPRVRRVIAPFLRGEDWHNASPEDRQYVVDLGLVIEPSDGPPRIANEIYNEVIPRTLTSTAQVGLSTRVIRADHILPDGSLNFRLLLERFQQFILENYEIWKERVTYEEAAPQLLLQAWLQRVINGGEIQREFGLGSGSVDIFARHRYEHNGVRREQRFVVEVKVVRKKRSVEQTIQEGLVQVAKYIDSSNPQEAHLIVFHPRSPTCEDKVLVQERVQDGRKITVWGM